MKLLSLVLKTTFNMFKVTDKINTPKGPGVIKELRKSTYSRNILFYIVILDSTGEEYFCPTDSARKL